MMGFMAETQTERNWIEKRRCHMWRERKYGQKRKIQFSHSESLFSSVEPCLSYKSKIYYLNYIIIFSLPRQAKLQDPFSNISAGFLPFAVRIGWFP